MAGREEPDYLSPGSLHPTPAESLDPMPVDADVISIAEKMKKGAETKLKKSYTSYIPLWYIKNRGIAYCIRVSLSFVDINLLNCHLGGG